MRELTSSSGLRSKWLEQLLSTTPSDRPRAEAAVRRLYSAAGLREPHHVVWFESPFGASWLVALLIAPYHQLWSQRLSSGASRSDREQLDRARSALGSALGLADPKAALAAAGAPLGQHLQFPPVPSRMLTTTFLTARYTLSDDVTSLFTQHGEDDDLARAEMYYWGSNRGALVSALHCPTTDRLIGNSFFGDYSFSTMADDERRVGDREPPGLLAAAWEVARSSGMWWPFEGVAVMTDRPAELHVNQKYLLHRSDGPAAVYRDGWTAYAWNGKAVPEKWIMHPEAVPPREYKGFDPTFAQHVKARAATTTVKPKKRGKPDAILNTALPVDAHARIEHLRAHAGGKLPLYDRYQAGAHRDVWRELVSLGASVREPTYAADALAVAFETMRRVQSNVRTVVHHLTAMRYRFGVPGQRQETGRGHTPPAGDIHRQIAKFEREHGVLPLALRTFYEIVGEVDLVGSHPTLAPATGAVAPDPLVVFGLNEGAVDDADDEEGGPSAITIAPDDLHKANTSGGAPYEMAIPDLRADGELLNERHHLFFIDYLRLAFRFGGFPGYDGAAEVPAEISILQSGLLEF